MEQHPTGLQELKNSGFAISENQPDIEGWTIYDGQHQDLGKVHDLLFDPATQQVRYIIAQVMAEGDDALTQRLIPIGMAELHASDDEVILPTINAGRLDEFAPYPFDALRNNALPGSPAMTGNAGMVSDHGQFSDQHFYRNRPVVPGNTDQVIRLRSRLEDQSQNVFNIHNK